MCNRLLLHVTCSKQMAALQLHKKLWQTPGDAPPSQRTFAQLALLMIPPPTTTNKTPRAVTASKQCHHSWTAVNMHVHWTGFKKGVTREGHSSSLQHYSDNTTSQIITSTPCSGPQAPGLIDMRPHLRNALSLCCKACFACTPLGGTNINSLPWRVAAARKALRSNNRCLSDRPKNKSLDMRASDVPFKVK